MNLLSPFLILLVATFSPTGPDDSDKDKKKGKDQYYKYEREDVSAFRENVDFRLPDPIPAQALSPKPVTTPRPVELGPRFNGGQRVVVDASPALQQLVARDRELKRQIDQLPGFRVHVHAGTARQQAWDAKRRSLGAFPNTSSYLEFVSPNYVVRLGDFLDRDEAMMFLREVRGFFPGAFLVSDQVKVPKPDLTGGRD